MGEARIAGAEIVESDPNAGSAELAEATGNHAVSVKERVFGYLELQPFRIEAGLVHDPQEMQGRAVMRLNG